MGIIENTTELLKERRIEQKALADYLGISQQQFTDWKAGRNRSYSKYVAEIARFFDVSTDRILTGKDASDAEEPEELVIIGRAARKMTKEQRQRLLAIAMAAFKDEFNGEITKHE